MDPALLTSPYSTHLYPSLHAPKAPAAKRNPPPPSSHWPRRIRFQAASPDRYSCPILPPTHTLPLPLPYSLQSLPAIISTLLFYPGKMPNRPRPVRTPPAPSNREFLGRTPQTTPPLFNIFSLGPQQFTHSPTLLYRALGALPSPLPCPGHPVPGEIPSYPILPEPADLSDRTLLSLVSSWLAGSAFSPFNDLSMRSVEPLLRTPQASLKPPARSSSSPFHLSILTVW